MSVEHPWFTVEFKTVLMRLMLAGEIEGFKFIDTGFWVLTNDDVVWNYTLTKVPPKEEGLKNHISRIVHPLIGDEISDQRLDSLVVDIMNDIPDGWSKRDGVWSFSDD